MKRYVKGNAVYNGRDIVVGDVRIVNPTEEQLLAAGYVAEAIVVDEGAQRSAEALAALAEGDYRVIKCSEVLIKALAKRFDIELPYDIDALHDEREALRRQVNE